MTEPQSKFRQFFETIGSWKLGVALLILIAAASTLGTIIPQDPFHDVAPAQRSVAAFLRWMAGPRDIFHSGLYLGLLWVLALNILSATIARFSLRPEKLGALAAHVGLLLVLLGGFLYLLHGDKGVIAFAEGDTADKYLSKRDGLYKPLPFAIHLTSFVADYYPSKMLLIGPEKNAVSLEPKEGDNITLPWTTARVAVKKVIRNARRVTEVLPDNGPLNPAAHFKLETDEGAFDFWRFARNSSLAETLLRANGRIAISFDSIKMLDIDYGIRIDPALFVINRETGKTVERPCRAGDHFALSDTTPPAAGEIIEIMDDADNTTLGPGLRIQVQSDGRVGWRHVFARLPFFDPDVHAGRSVILPQYMFVYYRPRIVFKLLDKEGLFFMDSWMNGSRETGQVLFNKPFQVGTVKVTVLDVLNRAKVVTHYEPSAARAGIDAALVKVAWPAGPPREVWLSTTGSDRVVPLADALALAYVASEDVREYRSEVVLDDRTPATIRVNHPAECKGWQIFQEAGSPDETPPASRLVVSRDPGLRFVYAGFLLLIAGMFYSFFVKTMIVRSSKVAE